MGFFDEFKRLAHPYPDEEEEDYGDGFDTQPAPPNAATGTGTGAATAPPAATRPFIPTAGRTTSPAAGAIKW